MIRRLVSALGTAFVGGVVAGAAVVFTPVRTALVLDVYILFLGGVALRALVDATRPAHGRRSRSAFERAGRAKRRRDDRPPPLARLQDQVALATTAAGDVHVRLRPVLREIAAHRLWTRHAVDLDRAPERARPLLDDAVWEVVRADRPAPRDAFAPGLRPRELAAIVDGLERI